MLADLPREEELTGLTVGGKVDKVGRASRGRGFNRVGRGGRANRIDNVFKVSRVGKKK